MRILLYGGQPFHLQLELSCLLLSFFAYSPCGCSDTRIPTVTKKASVVSKEAPAVSKKAPTVGEGAPVVNKKLYN